MLDGLKRLFTGGAGPAETGHAWDAVLPWARQREYGFRAVQGDGFVIDGQLSGIPWRLEWGPSQRPYIAGHELRIRAELGLASELQAVVMNRALQQKMERDVFDQYVEGVQTRIDNQTPPEMRWLVMFPRIADKELPALAGRYSALSSLKSWMLTWLDGPLSLALQALRVDPEVPMVLMIGRGRLMLRTALAQPDIEALLLWLRLFESAIREARRAAHSEGEAGAPHSEPSIWSASALPGDEHLR